MPDELSGIGLDFFELVIRHYGDLRPEFQLKIYDGTDHKHHWEFLGRMAPVLKTLTRETDNIEDILSLIDYCHHGPYAEMHCAMAQEVGPRDSNEIAKWIAEMKKLDADHLTYNVRKSFMRIYFSDYYLDR